LLLFGGCSAAGGDYFSVGGIEVKQKDRDTQSAKQKALKVAFRSALAKVISATLGLDSSVTEGISDQQISACMYDFSIDSEKYSDCFYIAELSCRFNKNDVYDLLQNRGIGLAVAVDEKNSEKMQIALYLQDFIDNVARLDNICTAVKCFSGEIIILEMAKDSLDVVKKMGIRYADV
jgi:hypothetical protein